MTALVETKLCRVCDRSFQAKSGSGRVGDATATVCDECRQLAENIAGTIADYRLAIEMARAGLLLGHPRAEAVAVLDAAMDEDRVVNAKESRRKARWLNRRSRRSGPPR